jgi:hypothetical protein
VAAPRRNPNVCAAGKTVPVRRRQRVDEQAIAMESELSPDMETTVEELDAIARLLGDDLKAILSKT